jgi:Protein of unknown function (DUF3485)
MPQVKRQKTKRPNPAEPVYRPQLSGVAAIAACIVLIAASGIFHGLWTGRWKFADEPAKAAERLEKVPLVIGDWDGDKQEISDREIRVAEAAGYLSRRYVHRQTGEIVWVTALCGRPGPISVHPPDVCFRGAGFQPAESPARYTLRRSGPETAQFWTAKFVKNEATGPVAMRVLWAWSATGAWLAPDNPRFAFAHYPVLYKLYIQYGASPDSGQGEENHADAFARMFLDELDRSLFAPAQKQTSPEGN